MRRLMSFIAILTLTACHGPSTIQTSAKEPLLREVEQEILDTHQMHHGDCPAARIVAARILENGAGVTQERWTLEGCGRTFTYDVTINHEGMGGQVSVHEHEILETP